MRHKTTYKFAFALAILASLFILWVNLAVGIIGEPENLANLMYVGVPTIGLLGAIIVRFRPTGMANVLQITAFAQFLVAAITVLAGLGYPPTPLISLLVFNLIMVAFWAGSALLFRKAAAAPFGKAAAH